MAAIVFPATWDNLLRLKNAVQEHDPDSTIFPTAGANLGRSTLGIGARFTTLHWPAVEWAMTALNLGVTANQNSIPRELVFDVDAMLEGRLDTVPFPFIGTNVPEGHQGQSVEGMSHGCVLSKLKTGFHRRRIAWSFNADHQPIGGKFDAREDALVRGCVLASYITFDLSPELAQTQAPADAAAWVKAHVPADLVDRVRSRVASVGLTLNEAEFSKLLAYVWPALEKMKRRDDKYRAAREKAFTTEVGRQYLARALHRRAARFDDAGNDGGDAVAVRGARHAHQFRRAGVRLSKEHAVSRQRRAARAHREAVGGVPRVRRKHRLPLRIGKVGGELSSDGRGDRRTSRDQDERPLHLRDGRGARDVEESSGCGAVARLVSLYARHGYRRRVQQRCHRAEDGAHVHHDHRLGVSPADASATEDLFDSPASCRSALEALPPSPEYMFFFEYNFLYVLAAGGRPDKTALGDHSPAGYAQRARFYAISPEARLNYAKAVADYIVFLAATTGLADANLCATAAARLERYTSLEEMLAEI